jgi:hypothetical protein
MNDFAKWIEQEYFEQAKAYRIALWKAWQSVIDFPMPVIISELRMVALPKFSKYNGNVPRSEQTAIFNTIRKPDFATIRAEFIKQYINKDTVTLAEKNGIRRS